MKQWVIACAGLVICFQIFVGSAASADYLNIEDSGFTRLPVSSRALGMGGAFVAVADDYSACYYNPAGLVSVENRQIGCMYTDLYGLGLLTHSFLAYVEPDSGMGSGALSWSHLSADLEPEQWTYDAWAYSYANSLSVGRGSTGNSWGATIKYLTQNSPYEQSATGYGLDIGFLQKNRAFSWGICVQDLLSNMSWSTGEADAIPINIMAGLSYVSDPRLLLALDIDLTFEDMPRAIRLGGEWTLTENVSIRGGLSKIFQDDSSITFSGGLGFNTEVATASNISGNYAFVSSDQLEGTHYFSLGFAF